MCGLLIEKEVAVPETMENKTMELNVRRIFSLVEKMVKDPAKIQKLEVVIDASDSFGSKHMQKDESSDPKFSDKVQITTTIVIPG